MKLSLIFVEVLLTAIYFEKCLCTPDEISGCRLSSSQKNITFVCYNNTNEDYANEIDRIAGDGLYGCSNLDGESFELLSDRGLVEEMHFLDCQLKVIPTIIFEHFINYQILDVSSLGLEEIAPLYVSASSKLKRLLASQNRIRRIPAHFPNKLEVMDLSFNEITEIDTASFGEGSKLKYFNVSFNNIQGLDANFFKNLPELRLLNLSHNQIETIPAKLFSNNEKLFAIDLSVNSIDHLSSDLFADHANDLQIVDLSLNKVVKLTDQLFRNAPNLNILNISNNKLMEIPRDFLNSIKKLDVVDLSCNEIREIGARAFPSMKSLDLSNNRIAELNSESFKGFDALEYLHLGHNQIARIPANMIKMAENLIELDFSFNNLTAIEAFEFPVAAQLTRLDLSHNKFVRFDTLSLQNLGKLIYLDISWNHIEKVYADVFQYLTKLIVLNMSNNPMKEVNGNHFTHLVNLQFLNLSSMSLTEIKPATLANQNALKKVDFSFNKIPSLNATVFPALPNQLKLIAIQNNTLEHLYGFESYPNTTKILIDGYYCEDWHSLLPQLNWYNSSKPLPCIPKPSTDTAQVNPETWILIVSITVPVVIVGVAAVLLWRYYCQKNIAEKLDHSGLTYVRSLATDFNYETLEEVN